jgi:membrane protease subunit HflK
MTDAGFPTISQSSNEPADRHQGVILVLLGATLVGVLTCLGAGVALRNPVLIDTAITLGISSGVLVCVSIALNGRMKLRAGGNVTPPDIDIPPGSQPEITFRSTDPKVMSSIAVTTAAVGGLATLVSQLRIFPASPLTTTPAIAGSMFCVCAVGVAATAVRYLTDQDAAEVPEAPSLARGARIVAWVFGLAAVSVGLQRLGLAAAVRVLDGIVAIVNLSLCYGLFRSEMPRGDRIQFPLDLIGLRTFGSRANVFASVLDSAERQLGIDLRSTWALTVVRRSAVPLLLALCAIGWLTTSLTIVGVAEQGLVERLGVPVQYPPLQPGIHLHWPWPIDRVFLAPVRRVQILTVGHEGNAENGGPEDVLWARQHAANEYTLLLGEGRDLITVDAAVQFRIADLRAWHYHSQNPADALRAIAHRAVMRTTINRTLAEALSENLVALTARMRTMVQTEADDLGLGVEILGFTVGGLHPPVLVAAAYQEVVSAELAKVTAVVDAQAYRNRTVPAAENSALLGPNAARAEREEALGRATGEAWSFRTVQSQFRTAPAEYSFRRRLETLETSLITRPFTVLDDRIQRDGGELWLMP